MLTPTFYYRGVVGKVSFEKVSFLGSLELTTCVTRSKQLWLKNSGVRVGFINHQRPLGTYLLEKRSKPTPGRNFNNFFSR